MKTYSLAVLLTLFCLAPGRLSAAFEPGLFKGYHRVLTQLKSRILADESAKNFDLLEFSGLGLGHVDNLGRYSGLGSGNRMSSQKPNGLSLLVWEYAFSAFSDELLQNCQPGQPHRLVLRDRFQAAVQELCRATSPAMLSETLYLDLWTQVIGHDSTQRGEVHAILKGRTKSAKGWQKDVLMSLWLNPFFLVEI